MNPFIKIHEAAHGSDFDRIGTGWEDTLTENFAHLLRVDRESLRALTNNLLRSTQESARRITTQYQTENYRPDIAIDLDSGHLLLIECKVEATLGHRQLERYLEARSISRQGAFCALIGRRHMPVPARVLNSPRYLRPAGAENWLWQDVFSMLPKPTEDLGVHHLRRCFLDYLELLGLAPSDLSDTWRHLLDEGEEAKQSRVAFGTRLGELRRWLRENGFHVTGDSQSGLAARPQADCQHGGAYVWLSLSPASVRRHLMEPEYSHSVKSAVFRVSLVYDTPVPPEEAWNVYANFPRPFRDVNEFEWWPVVPYKMRNRRTRLEVVASLQPFIGDGSGIQGRLASSCKGAVQELLRVTSAS